MSAMAAVDLAVLCANIIGEVVNIIREALKTDPVPSAEELREKLVGAINARTDDWLRDALKEADETYTHGPP